jgi:hypothetical protein
MYVHKFDVVFTHKEEALELLDYALGPLLFKCMRRNFMFWKPSLSALPYVL